MGIIRRWKNSIISLRLRFLEIPHKNIWVSRGVLFKGLGVQKKAPRRPAGYTKTMFKHEWVKIQIMSKLQMLAIDVIVFSVID